MYPVMIFLHVVSALLLGAYVMFPFLVGRAATLSGAAQESFVGVIAKINRIGQFSLIVTFLTGGAMVSQVDPMPSVLWMISSIVLLLIVGAITGMIGGRIKKLIANSKAGKSTASDAAKIKTFSWIAAVAVIVAVLIMTNPQLLS
ncbi:MULTISPECIES: hypothetical protein [unclassified Paenibacillus]|uniref:hypothetical protein n=1 Tax=unclassified Paenibacillus TaxID=185978 RepID=UPI002788CC3D|nr:MULTISPECIES: hypothetical protein [unclassified Paenibacillus]MDQ0897034.1 hypothetical protein [Paenibacillus sp. V4I7]MDQ0916818.1 hypothetical protein [Paenibacillus sp. V4I5]